MEPLEVPGSQFLAVAPSIYYLLSIICYLRFLRNPCEFEAPDSPEMEIVAHLFKLHAERTEMMGRSFSLQA